MNDWPVRLPVVLPCFTSFTGSVSSQIVFNDGNDNVPLDRLG